MTCSTRKHQVCPLRTIGGKCKSALPKYKATTFLWPLAEHRKQTWLPSRQEQADRRSPRFPAERGVAKMVKSGSRKSNNERNQAGPMASAERLGVFSALV